jgi:sugar (pentulose or hexulose) kinase
VKNKLNLLAVDLGASSGRVMHISFDGKRVAFEDEFRFKNGFINLCGGFYWDALSLYQHIVDGFSRYIRKGLDIRGVGVDTWGIDIVFLDKDGNMLAPPRCYRDTLFLETFRNSSGILDPKQSYMETGIMPWEFNTVYQLIAISRTDLWNAADSFLFMPDFFVYALTGEKGAEYSIALTSQLVDRKTGKFSEATIKKLGIDGIRYPDLKKGPCIRGKTSGSFAEAAGKRGIPVCNVNEHDTGSALFLAEGIGSDELLLNIGTWAIFSGVQKKQIVTEFSYQKSISNYQNAIADEGTSQGIYRPSKTTPGTFIIHQCKEWWNRNGNSYSWDEISKIAREAKSTGGRLNIEDPLFSLASNMPEAVRHYCTSRGMKVPETHGETARLVMESTALTWADYVSELETVTQKKAPRINLIGGGSQNMFQNELLANATDKAVFTGPAEATALGNALAQLISLGELTAADTRIMLNGLFHEAVPKPGI